MAGKLTEVGGTGRVGWELNPTSSVFGSGEYIQRRFKTPSPNNGVCGDPTQDQSGCNDQNGNGVADRSKDYDQQRYQVGLQKKLSLHSEGQVYVGQVRRSETRREFGDSRYDELIWGGWFSSLLAENTKLQASVESTFTDTVRDITFEDINTFTTDAVGAVHRARQRLLGGYQQADLPGPRTDRVAQAQGSSAARRLLAKGRVTDAQSSQNVFVRVLEPGGAQSTVRRDRLPPEAPLFCGGTTNCR